ncbi:hypothetical protein ACFSTE_14870 [Aquimarina hainanensis]|uniref:Tfp pilus assembly protein PilO n=1 Tax=Aquimarina hainanensis TaxID=1578017 RepID=A0ABW5ND30_9FLAO
MTQRTKNRLLITGLLLLAYIAYQYGFSKTVALRSEVVKLTEQKTQYQNAPAQLAALAAKEKQLDQILEKNNVAGNSVQNNLLATLNRLSDSTQVRITTFEKPHIFTEEVSKKTTTTYNFTLEGDYRSLLHILYQLEQRYSYGNIVSAGFIKKKNYKTRKQYLQCQVLLQRLN